MDLITHSLDLITSTQSSTGAFMASPHFPTYRYCWFRDGAFIAYALDQWGRSAAARQFHQWAARTVLAHRPAAERGIAKGKRSESLGPEDYLHTRYQADGNPGTEEWGNFQLDGLGTWLWSLEQHLKLAQRTPTVSELDAAGLVGRYLAALWRLPNYDCWEELPDRVHVSTLAAIAAGLRAASRLIKYSAFTAEAEATRQFVLDQGVMDGHLVKYLGSTEVDGNLLWVAWPYQLLPPSHPVIRNTVARIEQTLKEPNGGVHRYRADTYYGGGEWLLLTAWLGVYYALGQGQRQAQAVVRWLEEQANQEGHLSEQVGPQLHPGRYQEWVDRWGPVACPLLWSHASYLTLCATLKLRHG
ncbi:MAG: glycoside hydrolase family 15 protein [Deinococcus sp.]|nr:glycoside hydrolase family 15 protein [Deinococcus sp.]